MPLFDFVCQQCNHRFEELVAVGEIPGCPECDGTDLHRELPVFAVNSGASSPVPAAAPGPCGSCGDPRGPGACSMN